MPDDGYIVQVGGLNHEESIVIIVTIVSICMIPSLIMTIITIAIIISILIIVVAIVEVLDAQVVDGSCTDGCLTLLRFAIPFVSVSSQLSSEKTTLHHHTECVLKRALSVHPPCTHFHLLYPLLAETCLPRCRTLPTT